MCDDFVEKVRIALNKYAMLGNSKRVCAALSGGADSVSLLRVMRDLSEKLGIEVCACHLNHGLRGDESDSDERFCRDLCERLNVPIYAEKICVSDYSQKHESVEETARRVRYDFFTKALDYYGSDCVLATAHNANDNAETVLLNLTRGTGLKGLCGIPPVRELSDTGMRVIRPLINCSRNEIEEYLREIGQDYVTDKTNLSEDYSRNKIRRKILPLLSEINPSVASVIGRTTENLRADSEYLETLADKAFKETCEGRGWNAMAISRLPSPIKARVVRKILISGGIEPSTLRIETAISLLEKRSARFNPCKNRFFTIRKGICFTEHIVQHYGNITKKTD